MHFFVSWKCGDSGFQTVEGQCRFLLGVAETYQYQLANFRFGVHSTCRRHLIISILNLLCMSTISMPVKLIGPCLIMVVGVVLLAPSCCSIMGAILVWRWWSSSLSTAMVAREYCINGKYMVL
jgi:hypothetical protein